MQEIQLFLSGLGIIILGQVSKQEFFSKKKPLTQLVHVSIPVQVVQFLLQSLHLYVFKSVYYPDGHALRHFPEFGSKKSFGFEHDVQFVAVFSHVLHS